MTLFAVWFSFRGRINRKTFWFVSAIPSKTLALLLLLYLFAGPHMGGDATPLDIALGVAGLIALLVVPTWIWYAGLAKRCRDIGHSGWLCLMNTLPIIGFFFLIWCSIKAGKKQADHDNQET